MATTKKTAKKKSTKKVSPKRTSEPKPNPEDQVVGDAVATDEDEHLRDFLFHAVDFDDEGNPIGDGNPMIDEMQMVYDHADAVTGVITSFTHNMDGEDAVLAHTFFKGLETLGKEGQGIVKDALIGGADKGQTINTDIGKVQIKVVAEGKAQVYTDATTVLLEEKELLDSAAVITTKLKHDVTVAEIPDEHMQVLEKYFEVGYELDPDKINGLVSLGEIKQKELDATMEEAVVRKGYKSMTVTPTEDLKEIFGMGKPPEIDEG